MLTDSTRIVFYFDVNLWIVLFPVACVYPIDLDQLVIDNASNISAHKFCDNFIYYERAFRFKCETTVNTILHVHLSSCINARRNTSVAGRLSYHKKHRVVSGIMVSVENHGVADKVAMERY